MSTRMRKGAVLSLSLVPLTVDIVCAVVVVVDVVGVVVGKGVLVDAVVC